MRAIVLVVLLFASPACAAEMSYLHGHIALSYADIVVGGEGVGVIFNGAAGGFSGDAAIPAGSYTLFADILGEYDFTVQPGRHYEVFYHGGEVLYIAESTRHDGAMAAFYRGFYCFAACWLGAFMVGMLRKVARPSSVDV